MHLSGSNCSNLQVQAVLTAMTVIINESIWLIVLQPSLVVLRWLCDSPRTGCAWRTKICMVEQASNNKRDCYAWSLLLLVATMRSFAHMPLEISDRNKMVLWPGCEGRAEFSLHAKNVRSGRFVVKRKGCCQWRSQPRNWGGGKTFDFRRITLGILFGKTTLKAQNDYIF